MGIFNRHQNVQFERDAEGNVIKVVRSGDSDKGSPVTKAMMQEYKKEHPNRWEKYKARRAAEKEVYNEEFEKVKMATIKQRAARVAKQRYSQTPMERLSKMTSGIKFSGPGPSMNANPFGSLFDMGSHAPKKHKSTAKTKKGKKGKKKKGKKFKKVSSKKEVNAFGGFDNVDNWGLL